MVEKCWRRVFVVEKCCREVLEKSVVERGVLWRKECCGEKSVGGECSQSGLLQRFAVAVEPTLRWKRCWMRCALQTANERHPSLNLTNVVRSHISSSLDMKWCQYALGG